MSIAIRPAVVLVTGQLLTAEIWAPQLPALTREFDVRFADQMRDDTIVGMAERLLREAPPVFDLVAHAMGGFIAFEALRLAPGRIRSLVLMSSLASPDGPAQTERRSNYIRLVAEGRFEDLIEQRIRILLHPARWEDERLVGAIRRMATDTGPETFTVQQRAIMGRRDSRPFLHQLDLPVLVVRGEEDRITTDEDQQEMIKAIPSAELQTLSSCGHLASLEKPATVSALLGQWLKDRN